jgi:diacylglycerol kinase family enzyme
MRGIVYAALHAIATYRVRGMAIRSGEGEAIETGVTNLGVVKNPHFTGSLSYDSPHEPDSGYFHVHLCKRTSIVGTLITLIRLLWGKFSGVHWTRSWRAKSLHVTANRLFAVEYDGEVVRTRCVSFSIRHKLLRVCT